MNEKGSVVLQLSYYHDYIIVMSCNVSTKLIHQLFASSRFYYEPYIIHDSTVNNIYKALN